MSTVTACMCETCRIPFYAEWREVGDVHSCEACGDMIFNLVFDCDCIGDAVFAVPPNGRCSQCGSKLTRSLDEDAVDKLQELLE